MKPVLQKIAAFVTPHGFGHAARSSAVIAALQALQPDIEVDLFARTPPWFFEGAIDGLWRYQELTTDIGLVQESPLREDMTATIAQLDAFLPFGEVLLDDLAQQLQRSGCRLVISDIAPLGIAVAERAGIPSLLIENFTWDWIYRGYTDRAAELESHIRYLAMLFSRATYHIQATPICEAVPCNLTTGPISRKPKHARDVIRQQLGVMESEKLVLVTMGGIPTAYPFIDSLRPVKDCRFLVPGDNVEIEVHENTILLPYRSGYYHPDLVAAADAVIGKVGYSTLAEVYHAGLPFGYFTRSDFRESNVLSQFVSQQMDGLPMTTEEYIDGSWTARLPDLLEMPRRNRGEPNGADQAALFIANLLQGREP